MKKNEQIILCGNNIDLLKNYPDNYFDAIVTDPPYGLGKEPYAQELMRDWIERGYHEVSGGGFMGKDWDAFVPQPLFWKETFRVLKHGGHVLSFFGTRTYDWGVMSMRFAGFEIRDCIQWLYGSGFPKSYNVAKGIEDKIVNGSLSWNDWKKLDGEKEQVSWGYSKNQSEQGYRDDYTEANKERVGKVNFQSQEAKQWEGWGSALKPANEPIVLARKPLEKGLSIAENVLKWGVGAINIDGCRVNLSKGDDARLGGNGAWKTDNMAKNVYRGGYEGRDVESSALGRFPANLILTHHPKCECVGTGQEEVEDWNCHPDCPIKILDEQSGISKSSCGGGEKPMGVASNQGGLGDKRGASRFFYVAKASKREKNYGLNEFEERQSVGGAGGIGDYINDVNSASGKYGSEKAPNKNFHPTVKPIKLMEYLVKLITPSNGIVLDPFCGSGTTGIACKLQGVSFVGLELDKEYFEIAQARINNYNKDDSSMDSEQNNNNQLSIFD